MKRRDMGELFAKVLGVFFLYLFFGSFQSGMYSTFITGRQRTPSLYFPEMTMIASVVLLLIAGLVCLFKSKTVGRILYPDNPDGILIENINVFEAQVLVFSSIGLIIMIFGVFGFVSQLGPYLHFVAMTDQTTMDVFEKNWQRFFYTSWLVSCVLQIVLGYYLFRRARALSTRLHGGKEKPAEG